MTDSPLNAIDQILTHNAGYAKTYAREVLSAPPRKKLLVIACMDARINVEKALGLHYGDAHILRNAGGTVTEDVLRSTIVSTNVLGTREVMVINHTGCGMMSCGEDELRSNLEDAHGQSDQPPAHFHTFTDLDDHVREQVAVLRDHPWVPSDLVIRGFTYDVETGQLHEIECG